ncbi:MAG TPA: multidrug effflux MFS transporter [Stellaceae bacterium]|nr:multidrug effflux MFS transporter [Stellaceae bacterium]
MLLPGSRGFVILLGAFTALSALSIDMSLPALPLLMRLFATTPAAAQWTLSGFLLGFAGGQLVCGPAADRFGRRPVLLVGLAIFTLGTLGCAASQTMEQLIACRVISGIGACVGPILSRTIVRDLFDRAVGAHILSAITLVMAVAPLLAPTLGGYFVEFLNWRLIFVVIGVFGAVVFGVAWRRLPESIAARDVHALRPRRLAANYWRFLSTRSSMGYAIVNCLAFSGLFCYISGSPFVLIEVFGVPTPLFGYIFALPALALMIGSTANRLMLRRLTPETILQVGLGIIALCGLGIATAARFDLAGLAGVMVPMTGYVFAIGILLPNSTAAAMEPLSEMAGVASSLLGFLQMAGAGLVGYLLSMFYDHTALPMSVSVAALGLAACAAYYIIVPTVPRSQLAE